jgi:hypothetical protein
MITRVFIPIIVDPDWNERNVRASCPGPDFVDDAGLQQGVHEVDVCFWQQLWRGAISLTKVTT